MGTLPPELQERLRNFVAEAAATPTRSATTRRVFGPVMFPGKATAVLGMRRAGKTTFLHQLRADRIAKGAKLDEAPYWNFEDERLAGLDLSGLSGLYQEHLRLSGGAAPKLLCLDEIQLVPGWERFVRRILDASTHDVVISGSSAAMLSREVATSMRGRGWEVVIHPFSFAEALVHAGQDPAANRSTSRARAAVDARLRSWLHAGGFPEAQGLDDATRIRLLRDYVDVAVLRDVVERHEVKSVSALRWMVRHLLGNAGASFSVQKFFDSLKSQGLKVGKDTLHDLLAYLTDCFLVRTVWLETDSERRRMVNPRKVYPVDSGLIATFDRSGKPNLGHALETAVLVELERRGAEVTYVKTTDGFEVDFLARFPGSPPQLIQVAASAADPQTAERELRALHEAMREQPNATAHLVVLDDSGLPRATPSGIRAVAAADWFLGAP